MERDDAKAAVALGTLAMAGVLARWFLATATSAPGDVTFGPPNVQQPDSTRAVSLLLSEPLRPGERVDLNVAPAPELTRLPGIGPVLAQRIVEDRSRRGPFRNLEDFDRVKGVGPKLLERIRAHAAFSGRHARPKSLDSP